MKTPIYLDNNATTPVDARVLEHMRPVFEEHFGNASSSTHRHGWYAKELVEIAREQVAALIGASAAEIIFTSGATESNNLAIRGTIARLTTTGRAPLRAISAKTEHRAVLDPLAAFPDSVCKTTLLNVDADGRVACKQLQAALNDEVALVSLMLGNNEIGVMHDIRALSRVCSGRNLVFHCDATQAVGKIPLDVASLGVDLLSLSGHKLYGPKGIGALYVKKGVQLEPLIYGGGQERNFRSGTLNVPGIVGLGAACELCKQELASDSRRICSLADQLLVALQNSIPDTRLNGSREHRIPGNLNLTFPGVDSAELIGALSAKVSLSSTSACTSASDVPSHVLAAIGLPEELARASIRIGIGRFTTEEEISFAAEVIANTALSLRS